MAGTSPAMTETELWLVVLKHQSGVYPTNVLTLHFHPLASYCHKELVAL
jgi:hypothetical protein